MDIGVPRLKSPKFSSVPLALPTLKVYTISDNGVTQLMVENWRYPPTRGWLKELSRYDYPSPSDVT
jgi:hypothetical protein